MSETVFVTGAAGMIGAQVVRGLLAAGYTVVGADRRSGEIEDVQYRHLVLDLADADAVTAACTEQHITRVIHLAALAHTAGETDLSYETYYRINVVCAKNVFAAAKAGRFLQIDAERALQKGCDKFIGRFRLVEELTGDKPLSERPVEELEQLWRQAKEQET